MQIRLQTRAVLPGLVAMEMGRGKKVNRPGKGKPMDPYKYQIHQVYELKDLLQHMWLRVRKINTPKIKLVQFYT